MTGVYLVEDDGLSRRALTAALGALGQPVEAFPDAERARAAIEAAPPALLVTDVRLPGASGVELCRWVRERHDRLALPVLVVSSADALDDLALAYEAGADDYLVKPVAAEELTRKARLLLERGLERRAVGGWSRYQLLERLGQGQTAAIWRARRQADGSELALKVVGPEAGREAVATLLGEAELLRSLADVSGVVRVRDMGSEGGSTFYAMDLVPGLTLTAVLEERRRLPAAEAAALGRRLAGTLAALASAGVVHGDLKPDNVLLSPGGPVLVDFGLARRVGSPARGRGGTLTYLAPEVVRGGETSARSDVYSLGTVLFEVLTGRLPYPASGAALAALKVEGAAPELEPLLDLELPPGLVAIVEEALQVDPERRTGRASDLATALLPYTSR